MNMDRELRSKLIYILSHFKNGLDDVEEGSGERQQMQDEIDYALPLVKKLNITPVVDSCNDGWEMCDGCNSVQKCLKGNKCLCP